MRRRLLPRGRKRATKHWAPWASNKAADSSTPSGRKAHTVRLNLSCGRYLTNPMASRQGEAVESRLGTVKRTLYDNGFGLLPP